MRLGDRRLTITLSLYKRIREHPTLADLAIRSINHIIIVAAVQLFDAIAYYLTYLPTQYIRYDNDKNIKCTTYRRLYER